MIKKMLGGASASPTTENHQVYKPTTTTSSGTAVVQRKKNKNNNNKSRRFNDEQIKSLESLFKLENKLEPRKKLEMARELGLDPRQVAIWFQNRRARWKSKQVEQDYTTLKADYHTLTHRFESLKKEKHALIQQLRNLCSQLKEEGISSKDNLDMNGSSENEDHELNGDGNSSGFSGGPLDQDIMAIYSEEEEEDNNNNDDPIKQCQMKEEFQNINVQDDHQVTNFDMGSLFDQSCSNWWDVWSSNS